MSRRNVFENPPGPASIHPVWQIRLMAIIWFLLVLGCLLSLPILIDASPLLVLVAMAFAAITGAVLTVASRLISLRHRHKFGDAWVRASFVSFAVLCITCAAPIYYFAVKTAIDPALLPRVTLSNGQRTIILQGMMHVGSESFYKSVVYDAEVALADGYVLYYEGVRGDPAGDEWFAQHLAGGGDLSENYTTLSDVCGLKFQMDYFALLDKDREAHPERHVAADVSTLDMKREYERLIREDPAFARFALKNERDLATARAEAVPAAGAEYFDRVTESQKKLAGYVCRWMAARAVREASPDDQMKKVILDYRNRALVARIESASDSRIYVTYGAEHIRGIVDLLQAHDPDWRVEAISWISPIEAPVDLEGTF